MRRSRIIWQFSHAVSAKYETGKVCTAPKSLRDWPTFTQDWQCKTKTKIWRPKTAFFSLAVRRSHLWTYLWWVYTTLCHRCLRRATECRPETWTEAGSWRSDWSCSAPRRWRHRPPMTSRRQLLAAGRCCRSAAAAAGDDRVYCMADCDSAPTRYTWSVQHHHQHCHHHHHHHMHTMSHALHIATGRLDQACLQLDEVWRKSWWRRKTCFIWINTTLTLGCSGWQVPLCEFIWHVDMWRSLALTWVSIKSFNYFTTGTVSRLL